MAGLALAALLGGAACARPPAEAPSPRPEIEPTEAPFDRAAAERRAVLDAYQGYWDAILAANDPPDEFHPGLAQFATGEAFRAVFDRTQVNRVARRALRLPPGARYEHRAEVVLIQGDTATVRDCSIDDGTVVDADTGEVVSGGTVTRLSTATMLREGGTWKVSFTKVEQTWEGVAGCAPG